MLNAQDVGAAKVFAALRYIGASDGKDPPTSYTISDEFGRVVYRFPEG